MLHDRPDRLDHGNDRRLAEYANDDDADDDGDVDDDCDDDDDISSEVDVPVVHGDREH